MYFLWWKLFYRQSLGNVGNSQQTTCVKNSFCHCSWCWRHHCWIARFEQLKCFQFFHRVSSITVFAFSSSVYFCKNINVNIPYLVVFIYCQIIFSYYLIESYFSLCEVICLTIVYYLIPNYATISHYDTLSYIWTKIII